MIIKWIKKKILKSIINDLKKEMPHLKEEALKLLEVYKDELLEFCKKKLIYDRNRSEFYQKIPIYL